MKAQRTTEDDSQRHFLCSYALSTHPFGFDFLRIEGCHWDCPNSFTFWKGIVVVQFQGAVHTGKLAFTRGVPINETATENKGSRFRNRMSTEQGKKEEKDLTAQHPHHCQFFSFGKYKKYFIVTESKTTPRLTSSNTVRQDGQLGPHTSPSFLPLLEYRRFTTSW